MILLSSGAVKDKNPTGEYEKAVGKNSGMLQEAPVCLARDLFPKQQGQKCEKSLKGNQEGGVGGGYWRKPSE